MSNELIFIIGLSIGALLGVVTISMFVSVRITDLHAEIRDLRVQRNLLKEELKKPKGNTGWGVKIQDLFDGKHPNYPHWKLQERIVRNGYIAQECCNCGYDDYREADMRGPYIINFLDGDGTNHEIDNIQLLCYNCFFIIKPVGKLLNTPKNTDQIRRKLEKVWNENEEE